MSAGVRVVGAALVVLGVVVGIRVIGASQFGVSILVLSVGQLIAFPMTAMERLVIRYVAQGQPGAAGALLHRGRSLSGIILFTGLSSSAVVAWVATTASGFAVLAAALAAVSAGYVTLQQGACRAAGRLGWGQVPNEIVRPVATLAAYPLAASISSSMSGSLSVLIASTVVLVLMLFSPSVVVERAGATRLKSPWRSSATSLLVVSAVALLIERVYPLVLGWAGHASEVAIFAVVMRAIQTANFSQAFAVFYYSPAVARLFRQSSIAPEVDAHLTSRIRLIGLLSSVPAALLCIFGPALIEHLIGSDLSLSVELRIAAVAIVATALSGPAQTLLIMAGREREVAGAYVAGGLVSLTAFAGSGEATAATAVFAVSVSVTVWGVIQAVIARRVFGKWL